VVLNSIPFSLSLSLDNESTITPTSSATVTTATTATTATTPTTAAPTPTALLAQQPPPSLTTENEAGEVRTPSPHDEDGLLLSSAALADQPLVFLERFDSKGKIRVKGTAGITAAQRASVRSLRMANRKQRYSIYQVFRKVEGEDIFALSFTFSSQHFLTQPINNRYHNCRRQRNSSSKQGSHNYRLNNPPRSKRGI